ncbi:hypothetical protein GJ496_005542 [Pomphorhynchus laevis]|nr:hypothetical protein GJ496_005542 [Pomphorhynchus laevis]
MSKRKHSKIQETSFSSETSIAQLNKSNILQSITAQPPPNAYQSPLDTNKERSATVSKRRKSVINVVKSPLTSVEKFSPPSAEDMLKYSGIAQRAEIHAQRQLGLISQETAINLLHKADYTENQNLKSQMRSEMDKIGLGSLVDKLSADADAAHQNALLRQQMLMINSSATNFINAQQQIPIMYHLQPQPVNQLITQHSPQLIRSSPAMLILQTNYPMANSAIQMAESPILINRPAIEQPCTLFLNPNQLASTLPRIMPFKNVFTPVLQQPPICHLFF